jgi:zinc protease
VFRSARDAFGDWTRGPDPFVADPIPPVQPLTKSDGVLVEAPIGTVIVLLQWQGPSVGKDPQSTYAADVFSDVLNQPNSGFQRRLVDSGLFQSVGVNYYTLNQVGPISISGQTTPDKLREALAALEKEIARFNDPGYFTAAELEPVKQQRIVGTAMGLERASSFSHTIGFWWSVASLEYYMGYVDNMARQTPADLRAYAAKYIVGRPSVTGVMIDPSARAAIGLRESELVQPGVVQ